MPGKKTNDKEETAIIQTLASAGHTLGDKITQTFDFTVVDADGKTTTTSSGYSERGHLILDIGNTTKWAKNAVNPIITFKVAIRMTGSGTAFVELYDESTNDPITASEIQVVNQDIANIATLVIPQANFPNVDSLISVRTKKSGTGTLELRAASIQLEWTVI